jgi:hypothetical protein
MNGLFSLLLLAGMCKDPPIENHTDVWNKIDQLHLDSAIKRCPEIFPEYPCVKLFRKKEERVYNVICGK